MSHQVTASNYNCFNNCLHPYYPREEIASGSGQLKNTKADFVYLFGCLFFPNWGKLVKYLRKKVQTLCL